MRDPVPADGADARGIRGGATPRLVVLGIGNRDRSDDGAGAIVAERVRALLPEDVRVALLGGGLAGILEAWEGADAAVVVDAVCSGAPAGTVHRVDARSVALPAAHASSTHGLGLAQAVELARRLGTLPPQLVVLGIEAASFAPGDALSPPVAAALPALVARVCAEVRRLRGAS